MCIRDRLKTTGTPTPSPEKAALVHAAMVVGAPVQRYLCTTRTRTRRWTSRGSRGGNPARAKSLRVWAASPRLMGSSDRSEFARKRPSPT
eukprot:947165-Pyramimonas_sp.AAC.1